MKFPLDQDVPEDLSYLLRELGHEVSLLRDVISADAPDIAVLQFANDKPGRAADLQSAWT